MAFYSIYIYIENNQQIKNYITEHNKNNRNKFELL